MTVIITTTAKCNSYNNGTENELLPGVNERSPQNRWTNPQTDTLVELWKEYIILTETSRSHETWLKIRTEINKLGKEKTVLQCRNKILEGHLQECEKK